MPVNYSWLQMPMFQGFSCAQPTRTSVVVSTLHCYLCYCIVVIVLSFRSWGNSRDWVLELRDGRQVVIPPSLYQLTKSLTDFTGSEDDSGVAWDALSFDESYKGSLKQHVYQGAEKKNYDEYQESILEIKKSKKGDNFESWTE
ncbi:hypothetical protein CMV_017810 [Castanea mollissima]|uniref:Uncharacterized protein n=1 Tax=Castanea mollissima TaxID=60419 RepID=A0A8J4VGS8_9ROSI|nr:hypothetical protein CMV_017810 [Castanea mollissima]